MNNLQDLTPAQALAAARAKQAVIIDIRTEEEIREFSLSEAICAPMNVGSEDVSSCIKKVLEAADGAEVILMCRSGMRSKFLQEQMAACGHNVANMLGGITAAAEIV